MPLVYSEDALESQSLRNRYHRRVGETKRQIPVLMDQFAAPHQVFGHQLHQRERPRLDAGQKVQRRIYAQPRIEQVVDLRQQDGWQQECSRLRLHHNFHSRVVSVIGDSTFFHSGLTGLAEMAYNPPATGHVILVLDNGTTAMTGLQEHPGTGRRLDHRPAPRLSIEAAAEALGADAVATFDPVKEKDAFKEALQKAMQRSELTVLVTRRSCLLSSRKIREYERAEQQNCTCEVEEATA